MERVYGIAVPQGLYPWALVVAFGLAVTGVPLSGLAVVFGEEYGWRGFLQDELSQLGRWRGALVVGLVWGLWHFSVILSGVHTYPPTLLGLGLGLVFFVLWDFVQSYAVLKAKSIWVAAFLHGVVNSVYAFMLSYVVRPDDRVLSFGLGVYGLACLALVVLFVLRDPIWRTGSSEKQEGDGKTWIDFLILSPLTLSPLGVILGPAQANLRFGEPEVRWRKDRPMWKQYLFPESIEQALELLAQHIGQARIIAGGTDLVLQSQRGKCTSTVMVDITRIPGLDFLEEREGWIYVGPQVTHDQVARSPLIQERAGLLARACGEVGGPQLRHVATLVGNVINAMPAADGAVALFALEAEVEVTDQIGGRWTPIADLYGGVGYCRMNPCFQIVTGIRFRPLPAGAGWSFQRLTQRSANVLPILNCAVVVQPAQEQIAEARIAIGPVYVTPFRAREAEDHLRGMPPSEALIEQAAQAAQEAANPRDSLLRGSREYRRAMVEVLVRRGLHEAVARAGE